MILSLASAVWFPHGMCWNWNPWLLWSIVASHALTGASYYAISIAIVLLLRNLGKQIAMELPSQVYLIGFLFVAFVSACGTGHLVEILTVWVPIYGITAVIQVATAIISLAACLYFPSLAKSAIVQVATFEQTELELRRQAREYQLFFDKAHVSIFCKQEDLKHPETGAIMLWYNEELCRQFKISKHDWVGLKDTQFLVNKAGAEAIVQNDREVFRLGYLQVYEEASNTVGGMPGVYLCTKFAYEDPLSGLRRLGGVAIDVTQQKMTQAALRKANEELQETLEELNAKNEMIAVISQMSGALSACQTFEEIQRVVSATGAKLFDETISGDLCMLANSKDYAENQFYWGAARTSKQTFHPSECWALRLNQPHFVPDVTKHYLCDHLLSPVKGCHLCLPLGSRGEALSVLGVLHVYAQEPLNDLQQNVIKAMAEQLSIAIAGLISRQQTQEMLIRNRLTNLYNDRYLEETFPREVVRAARDGYPLSLLFLDVDDFGAFNKTMGHEAGDLVLCEIGKILLSRCRGGDIPTRLHGEELVVLLVDCDLECAQAKAEELRAAIETLVLTYQGRPLGRVTASFGVSVYPQHGTTLKALLNVADAAMRTAKAEGKNRVVLAS